MREERPTQHQVNLTFPNIGAQYSTANRARPGYFLAGFLVGVLGDDGGDDGIELPP